jgi:hypothetical protein
VQQPPCGFGTPLLGATMTTVRNEVWQNHAKERVHRRLLRTL